MQHAHALLHIHEIDWLAPLTRQALLKALQEATDQGSAYVYPEHVLLGLLTQEQSTVTWLLTSRGVKVADLRRRVQTFLSHNEVLQPGNSPTFSPDVLDYVHRAVLFLTTDRPQLSSSRQVTPELLTLSLFSHPLIQKLLAPYATNIIQLRQHMLKSLEIAATRQMERRFLFARRSGREEYPQLHVVSLHQGRSRRILTCIEPPHFHLQDIAKSQQSKRGVPVLCPELQELLAFLREPQPDSLSSRGMVFVEQPEQSSRQILRAVAGEADAPFITVFGAVIAEIWEQSDTDVQAMQEQVREAFIALRMLSAGLVFLEDFDLLFPHSDDERRGLLWHALLIELDKLLSQQNIVLVAAIRHPEQLPSEVVRPDRFSNRVIDELVQNYHFPSVMHVDKGLKHREKRPTHSPDRFCHACHRVAKDHWDFCIFCGAPLKRIKHTCKSCGTPYPDVEDAKFCAHCGQGLT
jgi:hypothetical protein